MANTHESFGQDVQRKSPDKFLCIQCHDLLFTGIAMKPAMHYPLPLWLIALDDGQFRKNMKIRFMTTKEIKSEIQKALDNVPENALHVILEYLKELEGKTGDPIKLARNLRDILNEDKELLESSSAPILDIPVEVISYQSISSPPGGAFSRQGHLCNDIVSL